MGVVMNETCKYVRNSSHSVTYDHPCDPPMSLTGHIILTRVWYIYKCNQWQLWFFYLQDQEVCQHQGAH